MISTATLIILVLMYLRVHACPTSCECWNYPIQRTLCNEGIDRFNGSIPKLTVILSINGSIRAISSQHTLKRFDLPVLSALKILHITHSGIGKLDAFVFQKFTILEELKLSFNRIQRVTLNTFQGLKKLKRLDLTGNTNVIIEPDSFSGFIKLEQLYLGETGLTHFSSDYFHGLRSLRILDLHGNHLVEFEYNFFKRINSLDFLDISGNNFQYLPKESYAELANITTLIIRDNPWHCNCEMVRVRDELRKQIYDPRNIAGALYCATPPTLTHLPLLDVETKDLVCSQPSNINCEHYNISANEGDSISLKCTMTGGDPIPYLNVKHPNGTLYNYRNETLSKYRAYRNGSFYINGASVQDSGTWIFSATNDHGKAVDKTISLDIRKRNLSILRSTTKTIASKALYTSTLNNLRTHAELQNSNNTKTKDTARPVGEKRERSASLSSSFHNESTGDYGVVIAVAVGSSVLTTLICLAFVFVCKKMKQKNKVSQFHN